MRDAFATCPRCDIALDSIGTQLTCGKCRGILILDRELYDLISEAQIQALLTSKRNDPWRREEFASDLAFASPTQPEASLRCPRCPASMSNHSLYGVLVDRCDAHGVWLDGDHELRAVVEGAAKRI